MMKQIPNLTPRHRHTYTHPVTSGKHLFVRIAQLFPEVSNLDRKKKKKENHSYQEEKF